MFGRGAKDQNVTEHKHKSCVKGVSNAFSLSMLCMSWRVLTRITWPFYPTEKERFLHSKNLSSLRGRCILTASALRRCTQNEAYQGAFPSC